jgi:hypothetical protein
MSAAVAAAGVAAAASVGASAEASVVEAWASWPGG